MLSGASLLCNGAIFPSSSSLLFSVPPALPRRPPPSPAGPSSFISTRVHGDVAESIYPIPFPPLILPPPRRLVLHRSFLFAERTNQSFASANKPTTFSFSRAVPARSAVPVVFNIRLPGEYRARATCYRDDRRSNGWRLLKEH